MTASLPAEVQRVFDRYITTEYTTIDRRGQPITWPVTPYYRPGDPCIDVTTGLGYPKKAKDARGNPKVALLFSDPTGSGCEGAPQVLVQGTAEVDDGDLRANRERYERESREKLPDRGGRPPSGLVGRLFGWHFTRLYVHVRPERVYAWPDGDAGREPQLYDAHMEEVRSGHDEEPADSHAAVRGDAPAWEARTDELGGRYRSAVVSLVAPDGFPFSVRLPIAADRGSRRIRLLGAPVGVPWQAGLACLTAHDHDPRLRWQRNFQVRGDLIEEEGAWALVPQKLIGGFERPPISTLGRYRLNAGKMLRFRRIAREELRSRR